MNLTLHVGGVGGFEHVASRDNIVQSLNSPFFPPHIGVSPYVLCIILSSKCLYSV